MLLINNPDQLSLPGPGHEAKMDESWAQHSSCFYNAASDIITDNSSRNNLPSARKKSFILHIRIIWRLKYEWAAGAGVQVEPIPGKKSS